MTIVSGNKVLATDYTTAAGTLSSTTAYPSVSQAVAKLAAIYGVGFRSVGYGQTAVTIPGVNNQTTISASDWISLRNALAQVSTHVGYSFPSLPPASAYASGSLITALPFDYQGAMQIIESRRLNQPATPVSQTLLTSVRTTKWTGAPQLEAVIDFGTEDAARYFFNSGGEIQITGAITGETNDQGHHWASLLSTAGAIRIRAETTEQSGSGGKPSSIGYYSLTNTWQRSFIQYSDGIYAINNIKLNLRRENYTGVNGANGSRVRLQFVLSDEYGGPLDYVDGTLTVSVTSVKAGGALTIATPAATLITGVDAGGSPPYFAFHDIITVNTLNYNLLTAATTAGYNPLSDIVLVATVDVQAGVVCGSNDVTIGGITVPTLLSGSSVLINNNGYIVGKGGAGGKGNAWGAPTAGSAGGVALKLQYATTINNKGIIGGGGGGGGGSTAWQSSQTYDDPGGGGGGGAGSLPGAAGGNFNSGGASGQPGSLLTGGAGGVPFPHGGSNEWWQASPGGAGGSLGAPGSAGSGSYGAGAAGAAGNSIIGVSYVVSGSTLGDIRGPTV